MKLDVTPGLVTADVDGERVVLAAATIPAGVWAAIDMNAPNVAQTLQHTWEEPLWPEELTAVGHPDAVAVVRQQLESDLETLLRWRGFGGDSGGSGTEWSAAALPQLPPPARRPPNSVPKRFGASGIPYAGDDVVEALVRIYDAF